jgi:hypothetical protein
MVTAIVMIAQIIYTSGNPQYKEQETLLDEQQFTMSEQLNAMMDKHCTCSNTICNAAATQSLSRLTKRA